MKPNDFKLILYWYHCVISIIEIYYFCFYLFECVLNHMCGLCYISIRQPWTRWQIAFPDPHNKEKWGKILGKILEIMKL